MTKFEIMFRPFKFRFHIAFGEWSFSVKGTSGNPDYETRYRHKCWNSTEWALPVSKNHRLVMHRWTR